MFKKSLILASVLALTMSTAFASDTVQKAVPLKPALETAKPDCKMPPPPPCQKSKEQFEKRLKLTDAQKEQAKQIRMKGHEEMKPIMEKMKQLKQEKQAVKLSRIAVQAQEEKIAAIDAQLKDLRKQAHELRIKNMKEFESILTDKQKKELKKMKAEGRKKFDKAKKKHQGQHPAPCHKMGPPPPPPMD